MQHPIDIGTVANDGTGDTLRVAFDKLNTDVAELFAWMTGGGSTDTPSQILAKLLTVDGAGSGLDADTLDGFTSAAFASASHAHAQSDITGLSASLAAKLDASSYTAADVLAKLLTVDGPASGLNADLLDGLNSTAFASSVHVHLIADVTGLQAALDAKLASASYTAADVLAKLITVDGSGSGLDADTLDGVSSAGFVAVGAYTAADVLAKLLTVDGSGSGLDADTLDGQSSAAFAAASHAHAIADVTGLQAALDGKGDLSSNASVSVDSELALFSGTTGKLVKRATGTGLATLAAGVLSLTDPATFATASHTHAQSDVTGLAASLAAKLDASAYTAADVLSKLLTVDGTGSGLDADKLDGLTSADFAAASHSHAQSEVTGLVAALAAKLDASSYTAADVLAKLITVDGSGSGLDADLLDGNSSAAFLQTSSYQGLTPTWTQPHTFSDRIHVIAAPIPAGLLGAGAGTVIIGATTTGTLALFQYGATPHIDLFRTNGSSGSETAIVSGNVLGNLRYSGNYSTGTFYSGAEISAVAAEDWSTTNRGARLDASVTKAATNTLVRILSLGSDLFSVLESSEGAQITIGSPAGANLAAVNGITSYTTGQQLVRLVARGSTASYQSVRINGTSASPTAVVSGNVLGGFTSRGAVDTTPTIASGALMQTVATENWSSSARGCNMTLQTVATGTTAAVTTLLLLGNQTQLRDGTLTVPALTFQTDLDTGLFLPGADQFAAVAGGVQIANFLLSGTTRVLTAGDGTNNAQIVCDGAAAGTRDLLFRTGGSARWYFRANATAEGGSNAGTDFEILRRTDAGASLGTALRITRSSGQWLYEDGTAAAPELSFASDADCGLYRIGTNNIGLAVNGANVIDVGASVLALNTTTLRLNTTTATTVGAAGGATALPATPLGYIAANVGGTAVKIPYYNN